MSAEAMANEPKAPEVSQVERLLAAIDHIVAQGFSTTVEYAIDEAWGLAQDIRAEMAR